MSSSASRTRCSYGLFLSYKLADHSFIENIAHRLSDVGSEPFLHHWYLTPGARWRPKHEEILTSSIVLGKGLDHPGDLPRNEPRFSELQARK
jgi:hypothetical protein